MRQIFPKIKEECEARQRAAKRYNPASVALIRWRQATYHMPLSCGTSDHVYFWQKGREVIALSINYRLGYAGIETAEIPAYRPDEDLKEFPLPKGHFDIENISDSLFFQGDEQMTESVGKGWADLSPRTIAQRMLNMVEDMA